MSLLRHLMAIAILPFTVTIVVPAWIARRDRISFTPAHAVIPLVMQLLGGGLLVVGLLLFASSLWRFATVGKGTLAPWDPPRALVVRGPYRWVRNPMISGVILVLFGEALILGSVPHAGWAAAFLVINLIYIPLLEEPQLEQRFGDSYRNYCRHVPRVIPRFRPWNPPDPSAGPPRASLP